MEKEGAKNHPPLSKLKGIVSIDPFSDHEIRAAGGKGGEETTTRRSIKTKNKKTQSTLTGENPAIRFSDCRLSLFPRMITVSEEAPRTDLVPEGKNHIR
jgi:hypothetical protein